MDLVIKNARAEGIGGLTAIGIENGKIAAISHEIEAADAHSIDARGCLVSAGFVESHIHLDKSDLLSRCKPGTDLAGAIAEVSQLKKAFTVEDVYRRARRTLQRSISHGTQLMRTHLETDPVIGLRSFEAIKQLFADYRWAVDAEICVFPQEGLLNYPGTEELLIAALKHGAQVLGAAPYFDTDPRGQMLRIFEIAREFDADIDMHLDFSLATDDPALLYVCELTEKYRYGGRVAIGHVTNLSAMPPARFLECARRLSDAGVAVTALPCTDLYLLGCDATHNVPRGVTCAHRLLDHGVNCSLATNNVLNPFTPFGDCSLIRVANLYANVCHASPGAEMQACYEMIGTRAARLMNAREYGLSVGNPANLVILNAASPEQAIAEIAPVTHAFKNGRLTVTREAAKLHPPL
jgi:cytosine/creatinine deaminase